MYKIKDLDPKGLIHNGDEMTQPEFFRLYERTKGFTAELIDGTVYIREPVGITHGDSHVRLVTIFGLYRAETKGVQVCDNASVILGPKDEVQPDLFMRILPDYKGQSRDIWRRKKLYVDGATELVAEVACDSKSVDLNKKRMRYELAGVHELLVLCLEPAKIFWFDFKTQTNIRRSSDGVYRSRAFPGLWIHEQALLTLDCKLSISTLEQGLASPEHREFVERLAATQSLQE